MSLNLVARLAAISLISFQLSAQVQPSVSVVTSVKAALGKLTYLRAPDGNDNLHFDSAGTLMGEHSPCAWTVCSALMPADIRIVGNFLIISGDRAVAIYDKDSGSLVPLPVSHKFTVSIELPRAPDAEIVTNILTANIFDPSDMSAKLRDYWQPSPSSSDCVVGSLSSHPVYKAPCEGLRVPKALHTPDPEYSETARKNNISAGDTLAVVVNEQGFVEIIEIASKAGAGLDINAIDAISRWKFAPATRYEEPVPFMLKIDVAFQLH